MKAKKVAKSKSVDVAVQGLSSHNEARAIEDTQWTKYKNQSGGHGFAAEDANALNEKLRLKSVDKIGTSNEKNGADRITNGVSIQTKYCQTASKSVNAAFEGGEYRYKGQQLEVPKDQYEKAVELFKQMIKDGKVPGVTDPEKATSIIKKGSVTYRQARNIARAGNIDSVWFDVKTQVVATSYAFGISFAIQYANGVRNGLKPREAVKVGIGAALKSGSTVMFAGILAQQFLRTSAGRAFAAVSTRMSRHVVNSLYKTGVGKKAIERLASALFKKALHGAAAKNAVAKIFRTNAVTAAATTVVLTIPDFYKALVSRSISWTQLGKNFAVNVAGVGGGAAGAMAGIALGGKVGAAAGAPGGPAGVAIGGTIGAAIGGVVGGVGGGAASAMGAKKVADLIVEDDAKKMVTLMNNVVSELAFDYLVTENEFEQLITPQISQMITPKWLTAMFKSGSKSPDPVLARKEFAQESLEPLFSTMASGREPITLPDVKLVNRELYKVQFKLLWAFASSKIKALFSAPERKAIENSELVEA